MNDKRIQDKRDPPVPKKTKTAEDKTHPPVESSAPVKTKKAGKRQSGRRSSTAKRPRKTTAAKDTADQTIQISASPQAEPSIAIDVSEDAIRLRAYFISERRHRFALPGDAESDWLEARRQLLAETRH